MPFGCIEGEPIDRLGIGSIGHTTAFVYDARLSVLALQLARNGITSTRISLYAEALAGGAGYSMLPVPNREVWNKLRHGGVRALTIRVSAPNDLEAEDAEARSIRGGMIGFKQALGPTHVEVTMSMSRGDPNINRQRALHIFKWLRTEREEERGGVTRLAASVVAPDAEQAEWLNLIAGQMGSKAKLDLPDDDPERSYRLRNDYIERVLRENRAELERRYG